MAMKKAAKKPASKQPSPPSPAKAAGKAAGAKGSKETSAKLRGVQNAYKKSGASYLKSGPNSMAGDLSGPNWKQLKGFEYGSPMFQRSRTEQRSIDQAKRAEEKKSANAKKVAKGKK